MRPIPVLLVTYNRLEYSKRALESILRAPGMPVRLIIWDNHSTEPGFETWLNSLTILSGIGGFPSLSEIVMSPKNVGLAPAINWFFRKYADEPYVAKVDNDTVLPDNWLADLMEVMEHCRVRVDKIGAVSGTCLRPNGPTFAEWTKAMDTKDFKIKRGDGPVEEYKLHFNEYVLGTGVLINMDMIRQRGLLFEKFPRSPESGPDDPCLISGWTAYTREAAVYEGWKFCFYSKVPVNLLNLRAEHVLSNDYPEYDAEVQKVRDEGNAWWTSVGGLDGVRKYVAEHGGLERLPGNYVHVSEIGHWPNEKPLRDPIGYTKSTKSELPPSVWSESDHLKESSTFEYWDKRVKENGPTAAPFLSTPVSRINEFTDYHMGILNQYLDGADTLEVGVGWGRMSRPIARLANSYVGVDFIPELVEKARESMPELDFRVASATDLSMFKDNSFDVVVAVACLSSFAAILDHVLPELKRVLRADGRILFLEEHYARIDWKLRST